MALVLIVKMIRVRIRCRKLDFSLLMRKMRPAVQTAFLSGSEIAALKKFTETAEGPVAISKSHTSLWIPLNQSMLSPIGSISFVLAPFFVAEITGTPVSVNFIFILLIHFMAATPGQSVMATLTAAEPNSAAATDQRVLYLRDRMPWISWPAP